MLLLSMVILAGEGIENLAHDSNFSETCYETGKKWVKYGRLL
jgi:hypothetical protein